MKTLIAAVAALGLVAAAAPAFAATQVGVGYTYLKANHSTLGSIDGTVSVDLANNFGLEAQGGFGIKGDGSGASKVKENWNLAGYGTYRIPLNDSFSLDGRVGYGMIDMKTGSSSKTNNGFAGGVGAQLNFDANNGLRADYTYQQVKHGHADGYGVQFVHKF